MSFKEKTLDHFYDDNYPREREKIMVQESQGSVVVPSNYGNEKTWSNPSIKVGLLILGTEKRV